LPFRFSPVSAIFLHRGAPPVLSPTDSFVTVLRGALSPHRPAGTNGKPQTTPEFGRWAAGPLGRRTGQEHDDRFIIRQGEKNVKIFLQTCLQNLPIVV
jgi:hypothetical protein